MNEQWFWRTRDEIFGPLARTDLERLSRDGKFREDDALRLGERGRWRPVADVMATLSGRSAPHDSAVSGSSAAARTIVDMEEEALRRAVAGGETGRRNPLRSFLSKIKGIGGSIGNRGGDLVGAILKPLTSLSGRLATLAVALVALAAVLVRLAGLGGPSIAEVHAQYTDIWSDVRELRARSASEEEWDALQRRARDSLAPIVASLEETQRSHPTNREYWFDSNRIKANIRRELIAMGKTGFPRILQYGRDEEGQAEKRLGQHMERITVYLAGDNPYPKKKKRRKPSQKTAPITENYATFGIVAVDALLVMGGGFWWIRRRRRK